MGGVGLGLAVVASIATSHCGVAVAENWVGGGAIVTVTFPSNESTPKLKSIHRS